jgi:hypothetical protein
MAKLYKAVDEIDGVESGFLIHDGMVAISPWIYENKEKIRISKKFINIYSYQNIEAFERRAINPVLIAEW